ncbi:MAG: 2-hydroxyacid dehydrogenase [Steroidobacteraceae bacterium]
MNNPRPVVLQLCPFSAYLESSLAAQFRVVRWFELDGAAQASWLAQNAAQVRGIATGGRVGCPAALLLALPALQVIAINGVGVDKVDLPLAATRGVRVGTTPGVVADDVADLAVGLVISLLRGIPAADAYVRAGQWPAGDRPLARKVSGCRFGIAGLGQIGAATAARLAPFGPVAYTGPQRKAVAYAFHEDLISLARAVDVLVLTLPATPQTRHIVNAAVLDALGSCGYLVNVARGAVVDEPALIEALQVGRIAGAALDVFESEPQVPEALRRHPRVVLTPHMATATAETRGQMADQVLAHLQSLLH